MIPEATWLEYLRDWSIIPIKRGGKKPLVDWKVFQSRKATPEEVRGWLTEWPDAQIACVTGKISGVVVLDFDGPLPDDLPPCPKSTTGRGTHCWFAYVPAQTAVSVRPGVDVRGDGGYVLIPPSVHPNGKKYEWTLEGHDAATWKRLGPPPAWAIQNGKAKWQQALGDVPSGQQNTLLTSLAGKLAKSLPEDLWPTIPTLLMAEAAKYDQDPQRPWTKHDIETIANSICAREKEKRSVWTPTIYHAIDRLQLPIVPIKWVVDRILPEGVCLLAGKPKKGKSWLALDIAWNVASGSPFWTGSSSLGTIAQGASFASTQGTVLYLAFEDGENRFRFRLSKIAPGYTGTNLDYTFEWPRMAEGGLDLLHETVSKIPNLRLMVIDTLAWLRQAKRGKNDIYQEDTEDIRGLKKLAGEFPMAVLLVHHLRKQESDDPGDMVSGSTGILATVDTYWVLKPTPSLTDEGWKRATLYVNGRDVSELEMAIERHDEESPAWRLLDISASHYQSQQQAKGVYETLADSKESLSPAEVADSMGEGSTNRVRQTLFRLHKQGKVRKVDRGRYQI